MARLLDCLSAFFSFGLELDADIAAGRVDRTAHDVQRQALALLEQARAAAGAGGATAVQIESASFAAVAWFDEIVARNPGWTAAVAPLQVQLFNSTNAHSEFFHHLSALQPADGEVREVYWYALVQGFKGQYYFESGDGGELGKLKALHAQQLPVRPLALADEHITPQPYGTPDPAGPREPQRRERTLVRAGGVLALAVPLAYLAVSALLGPRETTPSLAQRVEQQLQTYACADLYATAADDGALRVSGFVSQPDDMARVERDVRAMPGVRLAGIDLQLRIWPHCEVVALLKPYQARNRDERHGLQVAATTARKGRLREGDRVLFQVTNADYDGHLWVDYYTADGAVMHLNGSRGPSRVRPGAVIELGRDIPSSWLVSPPFGTVLVTVLSSPSASPPPAPLGDTADRPPFEQASAYLQRLRESLAAKQFGARLIADFMFLETAAR